MKEATRIFSEFLARTRYEDVPREVIRKGKFYLLDALGCGLGGSQTQPAKIAAGIAKSLSGDRVSTIIGDGTKVSSPGAAFANAVAINALDYDDVADIPNAMGHLGSTVVAATLAVGEDVKADGKEFITALILGYEVGQRIGIAIQPSAERWSRVWPTGTWQTLGAAAAAAKLMNLDPDKMTHAIGLAGSGAPVPAFWKSYENPRPLSWIKDQIQWAALAGVLGAEMARAGFIGNPRILDGERGFWRIAGSDRCDFGGMTNNLGKKYVFTETALKPYPACRGIHTALECIETIVRQDKIVPQGIEQVSVSIGAEFSELFYVYDVPYMVDAEFSVPYAVTMVVKKVPKGPGWYSEEHLRSAEVHSLMRKVKLQVLREPDEGARESKLVIGSSKVEVRMKDGRVFSRHVHHPKGSRQNPLTKEEITTKFSTLASYVLRRETVDAVVSTVAGIERLNDVSELTGLLRSREKASAGHHVKTRSRSRSPITRRKRER